MPSETSNAPTKLRVGVRPPVGNYQRVRLLDHSPTAAYMDEAIHEYLRRDLVVPSVYEIAGAMLVDGVARSPDWELRRDAHSAAVAVHALLLSRIEGDGRAACSEGDNDEA